MGFLRGDRTAIEFFCRELAWWPVQIAGFSLSREEWAHAQESRVERVDGILMLDTAIFVRPRSLGRLRATTRRVPSIWQGRLYRILSNDARWGCMGRKSFIGSEIATMPDDDLMSDRVRRTNLARFLRRPRSTIRLVKTSQHSI